MINARFFLDNKEVIGLWALYAIAMWLGVCILDLIFYTIKRKINNHLRRKNNIKRKIAEEIRRREYIEKLRIQNEFHKQFTQYIVNFEI